MFINDSLYDIQWYKDNQGNRALKKRINIPFPVLNSKIETGEVLDKNNHVYITDGNGNSLYETGIQNLINDTNKFKVNYGTGTVYVDFSREGQVLNLTYFAQVQINTKGKNTVLEDIDNNYVDKTAEGALKEAAERINNLVNGSTQPGEVQDAHLDAETGIVYDTLKQRLDQNKLDLNNKIGDLSEQGIIEGNLAEAIKNDRLSINDIAVLPKNTTTEELQAIVANENPLITKDFNVDNSININSPTTVGSYQKTLNLINGGSIFNVRADNVNIKETAFSDSSGSGTTELISIGGNDNVNINKNNFKNSNSHAIVADLPNVKKIKITENKINANNYGVLINDSTTDSRNAIITNNEIYSNKGDGIALNNPPSENAVSQDPNRVLHNVVVANNISETDDGSTSTFSGFGVSVADTHNVIVNGNIIPYGRTEGIHVEGTQENVIVSNNVLDDCKTDGMHILNINRTYNSLTYKGEPVIAVNNQIKKESLSKTGYGVYIINDGNGNVDNNIITGNIFKGFDTGAWLDGQSIQILDKNVFKGCNTAVKAYANSRIVGENLSIGNSALIDSAIGNGAIVDKLYSDIPPTNVIKTGGTGNRYVTSKGFYWRQLTSFTMTSNTTNTVNLFENPKLMQGKLFVELYGNNALDTLIMIADVIYDGTTYVLNNLLNVGKNAFSEKTLTLTNNSGQLALQIANVGGLTDTSFKYILEFDGYYMK